MLRWTVRQGVLLIEGDIDENAHLDDMELPADIAVVDFAGVRKINSAGVHNLINYLRSREGTIEAERCSPAVITQLNLLPGLSLQIRVRSLIANLECPRCLSQAEIVIKLPSTNKPPNIPLIPCEACGGSMELEEPEERLFAFLVPAPH